MGYNGYNNRRGGYGGGYRNNGYYPQQDYGRFPFDIGQVVIHKTTREELTVIRFGREQIECRLPNLSSEWFFVHELEPKPEDVK